MNKIKKSKRSTDAFVFALNEYKCGREKKPLRSKKKNLLFLSFRFPRRSG